MQCGKYGLCNGKYYGRNTRNDKPDKSYRKMKTADKSDNGNPTFVEILLFVLGVAITSALLFAALVIWIAELIGSTAIACAIVGAAVATASTILYFCSIRKAMRRLNEHMETVFETSRLLKSGYDRIRTWWNLIFGN